MCSVVDAADAVKERAGFSTCTPNNHTPHTFTNLRTASSYATLPTMFMTQRAVHLDFILGSTMNRLLSKGLISLFEPLTSLR